MAELHWFPAYVSDWLGSAAVSMMLPEQEGAYWRLLNLAWGNGAQQPSLPTDDAILAQMSRLGSRWKKLGPLVRAQFVERDGVLVNEVLTSIWWKQQANYATTLRKASAGGKAKAAKMAKARASANAQGVLEAVLEAQPKVCSTGAESESEEKVELSSLQDERVLPFSAPGGARSPEGARATVATDEQAADWTDTKTQIWEGLTAAERASATVSAREERERLERMRPRATTSAGVEP